MRERCDAIQTVVAGDFNVDLAKSVHGAVKAELMSFINDLRLFSAYELYPGTVFTSYDNASLGQTSLLDYFLVSDLTLVLDVFVVEPEVAYSADHLPVFCIINYEVPSTPPAAAPRKNPEYTPQIRWDRADLNTYYESTRVKLEPLYEHIIQVDCDFELLSRVSLVNYVDHFFTRLIEALILCSTETIPAVQRHFLKHWWSSELNVLKNDCIAAHRDWVRHGKPRTGDVFARRQLTRATYRREVRAAKRSREGAFSAKLQNLLLSKDTQTHRLLENMAL